jgi:hypothetical protein
VVHIFHAAASMFIIALFIGHAYMGTIGVTGSWQAMKTGYVDEGWAEEHHPLWHDDIVTGKIPAQRSVAAAAQRRAAGGLKPLSPRKAMRPVHCAALLSVALALPVLAKLPPPSDEAKAAAAETAAKAAWADKVGAYKLCLSQDRVADGYSKSGKASAPAAVQTARRPRARRRPVTIRLHRSRPLRRPRSPGRLQAARGLRRAFAAGTATSPPSTNATSAQISPKK